MSENFLDFINEEEKKSSGGGGWICKANIETGFKLFVKGADNLSTWFPYSNDKQKEKAVERANKAIDKFEQNGDNVYYQDGKRMRPTAGLCFILQHKNFLNYDNAENWEKGDRYCFHPFYSKDFKQLVKPLLTEAIQKSEITFTDEHWIKLSWRDTVTDKTVERENQETAEITIVPASVECIVEIYPTKADAQKAADDGGSGSSETSSSGSGNVPDGISANAWADTKDDIYEALAEIYGEDEKITKKTIREFADKYDVDKSFIKAIAEDVEENE